MDTNEMKQDKHFPLFVHNNLLRRVFFSKPGKYCSYVAPGQVVADLGCGPGFFTFSLAAAVGPTGIVYAVDSDEKAIRAVERRAKKHGFNNVKTYTASATDLGFIKDESVDFILADGLLCSMAPQYHEQATNEMRRILKPDGVAYLKAAQGSWSYAGPVEWARILEGFTVLKRGDEANGEGRWALVSKKR